MVHSEPRLRVAFYQKAAGREPVRQWLESLSREARKKIGEDILVIQLSWPVGQPLVRSLEGGLWEVRSRVPAGAARVLFLVDEGLMILLHGFMQKSQKMPRRELTLALERAGRWRKAGSR